MILSGKRKIGIAGLVVAALIAVAVPFLFLHGTSPGSSTNPTTTGGNGQNAGKNPTTTTTTTTTTNPSNGSNPGTGDNGDNGDNGNHGNHSSCNETSSHDPNHDSDLQGANENSNGNGQHNGNAYGVVKNKLDTTVALVKAMGTHDPAYHLHHDTDTDNDAAHGPHHVAHDPADHDSSCASGEEEHDQD